MMTRPADAVRERRAAASAQRDRLRAPEVSALLALSLLWGSAFLFTDVVVDNVAPFTVVAGRLIIAAVAMLGLVSVTRRRFPGRDTWLLLLVLAVLESVAPFCLITWAQQHVASSIAATLVATMPLFTVVIAAALATERASPERAAGVIVGFAGTALVIGPDLSDLTSSNIGGDMAIITAAACYAAGTVLARERLRGDAISLASGQMVFAALLAAPVALAVDPTPDVSVPARAAMAWVALGLLSSAAAYVMFFWLVQRASATYVSLVSYLIPIVAALLGWAVLDEDVGLTLLAGLALIFAGMAAANGSLPRLTRRALNS